MSDLTPDLRFTNRPPSADELRRAMWQTVLMTTRGDLSADECGAIGRVLDALASLTPAGP